MRPPSFTDLEERLANTQWVRIILLKCSLTKVIVPLVSCRQTMSWVLMFFLEKMQSSFKEQVVTTEKRTTVPRGNSKRRFLCPPGAQGKKVLNTPLCCIKWVKYLLFKLIQNLLFVDFKSFNILIVPSNHGPIHSLVRWQHFCKSNFLPSDATWTTPFCFQKENSMDGYKMLQV